MKTVLRVARTELLEQRRQPAMIAVMVANYGVLCLVVPLLLLMVDVAYQDPLLRERLLQYAHANGLDLPKAVGTLVKGVVMLNFTLFPVFVGLLTAATVLHDVESGTLPFLLTSQVTRFQLVTGKLLGASVIPWVLHLAFVGPSCLLLGRLALLDESREQLGWSLAWWLAFLPGSIASASFTGAVGTYLSGRARDLRTAVQFTAASTNLLSLAIGYVLVTQLPQGALFQVFVAACFAVGTLIALNRTAALLTPK